MFSRYCDDFTWIPNIGNRQKKTRWTADEFTFRLYSPKLTYTPDHM